MDAVKRRRLEKAGWRTGSVQEFLGLSDGDFAFIKLQIALHDHLEARRRRLRLSHRAIAKRLGSRRSSVARMETGGASPSIELLIRALLALGETPQSLGRVIARAA